MEYKDYNGWTNYETWNVALWFDSDEGLQNMWNEEAQKIVNKDLSPHYLAETMKEFVEEGNVLKNEASFYSDLMNAAISEVNFYEIAEHYITGSP